MAAIERRKARDGTDSFRVKVRIKGEKPRTRSFKRLTDARAWAAAVETDLGRGAYVPTTTDRRRTLAELIEKFVAEYLPIKPNCSDPEKHARLLEWWKADSGHLALEKVTPQAVAEARSRLSARRKKNGDLLSTASVNRYLAALSAVCKWAWKELHWMPANPVLSVTKGREGEGAGRTLEPDEQTALLRACRESKDPNIYLFVILALTTGSRYTPLRRLCWESVNFDRMTLDLGIQKNGKARVVPIVGPAGVALREHLERDPTKTGWVFKGQVDAAPADLEKVFRKIKTALGMTGARNFRIHDLRHTAASYLAMTGANEAVMMAALGWLSPAMARRYTHLYADHTRKTLQEMAEKFIGGGHE